MKAAATAAPTIPPARAPGEILCPLCCKDVVALVALEEAVPVSVRGDLAVPDAWMEPMVG